MATRQWKPTEERRVEIADAALKVIADKGIAAFTMEQLSREIGLSSGSLFRHFRSKEEILSTAVERAVALLYASFPPANLPALERLKAFFLARTRLVGKSAGIAHLVLSEQFLKALDEHSCARLRTIAGDSQRYVAEAIAEGQAVGQIRHDLSPKDLARLVMGSAFVTVLMQPTHDDIEQSWATLSTVLLP